MYIPSETYILGQCVRDVRSVAEDSNDSSFQRLSPTVQIHLGHKLGSPRIMTTLLHRTTSVGWGRGPHFRIASEIGCQTYWFTTRSFADKKVISITGTHAKGYRYPNVHVSIKEAVFSRSYVLSPEKAKSAMIPLSSEIQGQLHAR